MGSNPTAVFKPLIDNNSTKLKLPIGFVRKHRNFLPENAMLRIGTGKIWNVKIEEYSDDGGWNDFIADNQLVLGMSYSFEFDFAKKLILVSIRRRSEPSAGNAQIFCENNLQVGNILLSKFVADSENVVKVTVMENEVGKDMLIRARNGGLI
ncbi:hypothetical protein C2S51_034636 [Perilla frutescens var. frutescens]|nr:hypothetical protein C2S51_034636 [Perilla frutescens var. frutescens]